MREQDPGWRDGGLCSSFGDPLICLESPKQQKGVAVFYWASMRKEGGQG